MCISLWFSTMERLCENLGVRDAVTVPKSPRLRCHSNTNAVLAICLYSRQLCLKDSSWKFNQKHRIISIHSQVVKKKQQLIYLVLSLSQLLSKANLMLHQLSYHRSSLPFSLYLPVSPREGPFQKAELLPEIHANAKEVVKESLID